MNERKEQGAVVVEAIISMTTFVFTILIILSVADIAYVQSKIAVALNSAAGEMSQYCYLYYKFQLDDANAKASEGTETAAKTVEDTVQGLGQMMDSFGEAGSDFEEGNFIDAFEQIASGEKTANKTVTNLVNTVAEDPKGFLVGMGKLAGREITEAVKVYLGQFMAKAFMAKNLKSFADDEPDRFLRKLHVVDGLDGLDFHYTSLMAYGASNEIHLVCTYQVQVIRLLNIDFKFTFRQSAKTLAWGNGVSLITPRSIWSSMAPTARGKYIVSEEKKEFHYTSSGKGYDAFVNSKNEFVTITSIDPSSASYQDVSGVTNRLSKEFNNMYSKVSQMGDPITVQENGEEKQITSNPDTRTYKILLVLPEKTSEKYKKDIVEQSVTQLKEKYSDEKIIINVEVKEGYGSLPEKPGAKDAPEDSGGTAGG